MRLINTVTALVLLGFTLPLFAHNGPDEISLHVLEHILIALVIGSLPVGFILARRAIRVKRDDR